MDRSISLIDGLKCKQQISNTCSLVAVRIASELTTGNFTEEEKESWKYRYEDFIDNNLFNINNKVRYIKNGENTEAKIINRYPKWVLVKKRRMEEWFKAKDVKKYKNGRALGGIVKVGDLVLTNMDYTGTVTSIDGHYYKVQTINGIFNHVERNDMIALDGVALGLSINAFKNYFPERTFKAWRIPTSIANATRTEWLIKHLRTGKCAIFGIVNYRYPEKKNMPQPPNETYTSVEQDQDHQIKNRIRGKGRTYDAHAIVCVDFQPEKKGQFARARSNGIVTDGRYVMHDSTTYNGSCRKYIDSVEMEYEDNGGIVQTIYLVDTNDIPTACNRIRELKF